LKQFVAWHCSWCQSTLIYIASRGIDRFAEEIGTAFPNHQIINSSGDHIVNHVPHQPSLVVATPGSQPSTSGGYSAVALLEGTRFLGHTDLRSAETAREHFFEAASLASEFGTIFLTLDSGHPIVASLTRWDATAMVRKELQDREELKFPPYYRYISLETDSLEATLLYSGLEAALREERIPSQTQLSGPHPRENERSRILISAPFSVASSVIDFLHELQRRRSISHKPLFTMRVDPYSLTH
jgi:primosomal protein N' (replication factor Y)